MQCEQPQYSLKMYLIFLHWHLCVEQSPLQEHRKVYTSGSSFKNFKGKYSPLSLNFHPKLNGFLLEESEWSRVEHNLVIYRHLCMCPFVTKKEVGGKSSNLFLFLKNTNRGTLSAFVLELGSIVYTKKDSLVKAIWQFILF